MKKILLTQGKYALIDDSDFERVNKFKWCLNKNKVSRTEYAYHKERRNKKLVSVNMHTFIMGAQKGIEVDHKDGNGLNNQRKNLRLCSHAENLRNQRISKANTSGCKGVHFHKGAQKWQAQITKDGENKYLGIFLEKESAVIAYRQAELELFGEFAFM